MADNRKTVSEMTDEDAQYEQYIKAEKRRGIKNKLVALSFVFAVILVGILAIYIKFFKVEKIEIAGECPYSEEQMLEGLGIEKGDGLYDMSDKELSNNLKYNLALVDSAKFSRKWPDTIVVTVEKANPTFYISLDNNLYILSQSLRVLSKTDSIEKIETEGCIYLGAEGIKNCIEGEFLKLDKDAEEIIIELYETLEKIGEISNITAFDVKDKFDISLMYKEKYLVKLGDRRNINHKIQFMNAIIEQKKGDGTNGIIDVSDGDSKEGTFKNF